MAEALKFKWMPLADAFRAEVALVLLGLDFPQKRQFLLFCQFFNSRKLIFILLFSFIYLRETSRVRTWGKG